MSTLFISDLHIDAQRPEIAAQFLEFLHTEAAGAEALYILGDLFESWVGDDAPDTAQGAVLAGLNALTTAGVPCFVMHGNRDFLLSDGFCALSGARLLADPTVLTLYGRRVLVMHGDALCTDDVSYQRLRAAVRDAAWQAQFLALTVGQRRELANAARAGSRAHMATLPEQIADVNAAGVAAVLRDSGVNLLLHGHTHRPAIHQLAVDGRPCERIVLGDWYSQGSVLHWDSGGFALRTLPRNTQAGAGPGGPE